MNSTLEPGISAAFSYRVPGVSATAPELTVTLDARRLVIDPERFDAKVARKKAA